MSGDWCEKHKRNFAGDVVCWQCALEWKAVVEQATDVPLQARNKILREEVIDLKAEAERVRHCSCGAATVEDTPAPTCHFGEDILEMIAGKICDQTKARAAKCWPINLEVERGFCICDLVTDVIRTDRSRRPKS